MNQFIWIDAKLNYNDYNMYIRGNKLRYCYYNISPFERFNGLKLKAYRFIYSIKINNRIQIPFRHICNRFILDDNAINLLKSNLCVQMK